MSLRMSKWVLAALLFASASLAIASAGLLRGADAKTDAPFPGEHFLPLAPGTYWVYKGTVTSGDATSDPVKEVTENVSITMKVEKVYTKPELTAAVISGYPGDLDWSNGQVDTKPSLLIETSKHEVFLNSLPPDFDYKKLEADAASLEKLMPVENLLFHWPLKEGMKFGDEESVKRDDGMYCWLVLDQHKEKLAGIKGIAPREAEVSMLRFATHPDDMELVVTPGIGILYYRYNHHGTIAGTDVHLTEFHTGQNAFAAPGAKP
jgi:hypothetical protein